MNRLLLRRDGAALAPPPARAPRRTRLAKRQAPAAEAEARKAEWKKDSKHCEVCLKVMTEYAGSQGAA